MKKSSWNLILCALAPLIVTGCAEEQAAIKPQPPALVGSTVTPIASTERNPKKILMRMADFLAKTQRFSVNVYGSYDVVQDSGQKIEFGENRKVLVSRPDHLRVEVQQSDGNQNIVLYDGKDITVSTPAQNIYAQTSKPGNIDDAVVYFVRDLQMRLPLAVLLLSRISSELENRTQTLAFVEKTDVRGIPVSHLAGSTETVDYQVWVEEGNQPWPLRVVLTYKNAEGQPEFRAQFSDWNAAPEIDNSMFTFTPGDGAKKIAFASEVQKIAPQMQEKTGGKP